jgi:hypothetical protein
MGASTNGCFRVVASIYTTTSSVRMPTKCTHIRLASERDYPGDQLVDGQPLLWRVYTRKLQAIEHQPNSTILCLAVQQKTGQSSTSSCIARNVARVSSEDDRTETALSISWACRMAAVLQLLPTQSSNIITDSPLFSLEHRSTDRQTSSYSHDPAGAARPMALEPQPEVQCVIRGVGRSRLWCRGRHHSDEHEVYHVVRLPCISVSKAKTLTAIRVLFCRRCIFSIQN